MERDTFHSRAVYLFKPGRLIGDRWQRITPPEVFAGEFAVAPDGRWIAFSCSDGIAKGGGKVERPQQSEYEEFKIGETIIREGLCLIDREGKNFKWLVDMTTVADAPYWGIAWARDGQYIVFKSSADQWHRVAPQTGEIVSWQEDNTVQNYRDWHVDIPSISKEVIEKEGPRFCISSMDRGLGTPSPGGRYIAFTVSCGESDPLWLYAYDTKTERLLRLARAREFNFYNLVWLPD